jgi:hypothetical protein
MPLSHDCSILEARVTSALFCVRRSGKAAVKPGEACPLSSTS